MALPAPHAALQSARPRYATLHASRRTPGCGGVPAHSRSENQHYGASLRTPRLGCPSQRSPTRLCSFFIFQHDRTYAVPHANAFSPAVIAPVRLIVSVRPEGTRFFALYERKNRNTKEAN